MKKIILVLGVVFALSSAAFASESAWWEEENLEEEEEAEEEMEVEESAGRVYMTSEFLDGNLLKISVMTEGFEVPMVGVAFHLIYEVEELSFLKYEPGEFLEVGGDPFYLVQDRVEEGKLIFGETLRKEDDFPVGGGEVVNFYFQILKEDEFHFEFFKGVISTIDVVRQDITQVEWENFDTERGDSYEIVYDNSEKKLSFDRSSMVIFAGFLVAIFSFILCAFFVKKYGHKRARTYVNFK